MEAHYTGPCLFWGVIAPIALAVLVAHATDASKPELSSIDLHTLHMPQQSLWRYIGAAGAVCMGGSAVGVWCDVGSSGLVVECDLVGD